MDWLEEEVGEYEDDYLIIDCPGTSDVRILACNFFSYLGSSLRRAMPLRAWTLGNAGWLMVHMSSCRSDRALYTPSVPSHPRAKSATSRHAHVRSLSS
jgi:hypothetical protein